MEFKISELFPEQWIYLRKMNTIHWFWTSCSKLLYIITVSGHICCMGTYGSNLETWSKDWGVSSSALLYSPFMSFLWKKRLVFILKSSCLPCDKSRGLCFPIARSRWILFLLKTSLFMVKSTCFLLKTQTVWWFNQMFIKTLDLKT
jgi:hypothetical protein